MPEVTKNQAGLEEIYAVFVGVLQQPPPVSHTVKYNSKSLFQSLK
jgi:hypothetical protein